MSFGPLGTTRMACPDAINDQEMRFLDALARTSRFSFDGSLLVLSDKDERTLLRLSRNE